MKILESRPRSYDRSIDRISRGSVRRIKEEVASQLPPGLKVLEIGCGTGELASMLIGGGARVDGFDRSEVMIQAARERFRVENLDGKLTVRCMGVDSMDTLPDKAYDAVVATLVFSELTDDERRYALRHAARTLRPGGLLVIADEVVPRSAARRVVHALFRLPLLAMIYLISGSSTQPLRDPAEEISDAGFTMAKEARSHGDSFAVIVALRSKRDGDT